VKSVFLLIATSAMAILDLILRCAPCIVCSHATPIVKILHIFQLFFMYHNLCSGWFPWDSRYLSFFPHSFPFHGIFQFQLVYQSCPVCIASSTRSSAYFTVWITCRHILKSPNLSRVSLLRCLLYTLNRIGDKHPCLTPLPIIALLVSLWSCLIFTLWSIYNLISSLHASQYQFPLESALIWSILHSQMPSASPWSKCIIHLFPKFLLIPFLALCSKFYFQSLFSVSLLPNLVCVWWSCSCDGCCILELLASSLRQSL